MSSFPIRSRRITIAFVIACSIVAAVLFGAVTRAEFDPAAMFAPAITATKSDTSLSGDPDGKADPGETIGYTVQVNNAGVSPVDDATGVTFTDTIDANTTLVAGSVSSSAVASNDTLVPNVTGNVAINSATLAAPLSVLTNDYVGTNPASTISAVQAVSTVLAGNITATSSQGGTVVMNVTTGFFTYDPAPGFEGADTFTYVLSDNVNAASAAANRTATVSLNVTGMIWFINNNAPSCTTIAAGCGRLSSPFSDMASFVAVNGVVGPNNPGNNDNIFVYESSTAYTGLTLRPGQNLFGQDATASLSSISGITPAVGSLTFPAMNTGAPATTISGTAGVGVALNSTGTANTLRGFSVGNSTPGISGNTFGTLTLSEVIVNSNNAAIVLNTGTANATFTSVTSTGSNVNVNLTNIAGNVNLGTGALSGAVSYGVLINQGTASVSYAGTITAGNVTRPVEITNKTGGTVTFSGLVSTAAATTSNGPFMNANTGAIINFTGGVQVTTGTNPAFTATGGGTVSVIGSTNTLTTTSGTALNVQNTNIGLAGLTFRSISTNGASTGILLNNTGTTAGTHGGLTVTGTGTTDGTGGTIQNASTRGASLTSGRLMSLSNMNFTNAALTDSGSNCANLSLGGNSNLGCNAPIHLDTITGATLENLNITNSAQQGINGRNVSAFVLNNSVITGIGNAADEDGIHFLNMTGTSSITNTSVTGSFDDNMIVQNLSGTGTLTISGSTFANSTQGSGILFGIRGGVAAGSGANSTINIQGGTQSTNNFSGGIVADAFDGSIMALTVTGSTSSGNNDQLSVSAGDNSNVDLNANNNTLSSPNAGDFVAISLLGSAFDTGYTFDSRIQNNTISIGVGRPTDGIIAFNAGGGALNSVITNNNITYGGTQRAIIFQAGQDGSGSTNATIQTNTINITSTPTVANTGILMQTAITGPGNTSSMCADIGGAGALSNTFSHTAGGNVSAAGDIRVRQRNDGTFRLPGYGGAAGNPIPVVNYINGQNAEITTSTATLDSSGFAGGAACTQPSPVINPIEEASTLETDRQEQLKAIDELIASVERINSGQIDTPQIATGEAQIADAETGVLQSISNFANRIFSIIVPTASAQNNIGAKPMAPQSGESINLTIGTLPAGKSVTITFNVTFDGPSPSTEVISRILNQGTVSGSNFSNVITSDPAASADSACTAAPALGGATCTPVDRPDTTVTSVNRVTTSPTNAASVQWTVTFANAVGGLSAANLTLNDTTASCSGESLGTITAGPGANEWTVNANTGTGSCTLRLDVANSNGLSHDITNLPFITGQTIVVDKLAPSTTSFTRFNPATNPTNADTLVFQATFSENVINVDAADFAVTGTTATVTGVAGVGGGPDFSVYNVTVSGGDLAGLNGTVGLNFSGGLNITDAATNALPNTEPPTDQTYLVDNTAPTVNIVDVAPDPRNTAVASIAINFSEDVTGFDIADLTLTRDAGANLLPGGASIAGGAQNYTLATTTAVTTTDGAYLLTLAAPGGITDAAGNALVIGDTDSWVKDAVAPTVTINQAVGQSDPTFQNPINFTATFNEPVTDFDDVTDVVITGTAAGVGTATKVITPVTTTVYTIAVSGITGDGTVIANIPAGVAIDAATNSNAASISTDNTVTFVTCVPPPANMLAWYTGDGTPRDIAGGIDGTLVNGATYGAGKVGQAFDFDGVNDVVTAPGNGALNITGNQMSQDAWVYPRTHLNGGFIVGKSALSDHPYVMYNVGVNIHLIISTTSLSNQEFNTGYSMPLNQWTHLAMTYDGTLGSNQLKLYANGAQVFQTNIVGTGLRSSTLPVAVGNRATNPVTSFDGLIDEVEIFNRALSLAEVQGIFNADGGGKCKPFDLRIDKEDVNAPFDQGAAESYTIVVTNDGPATTAGTTTVTDTFPAGITPGAATGTNWSCNTTLQVLTCTSTQAITAGNVFPTITVPVTVAQNAPASVSNTATVATSPTTGELDTSDNSDTEVTAVTGLALTPSVTGGSTLEDTQTPNGQLVITPNALDGSEVTHYKITNIANGSLFQNNGTTPIAAGSFITAAQGAAGLRFTPALNFFGNGSFDVTASTSAGDPGLGGAPATATIVVTPVNDAPTLNDPADVNIDEDAGLQTVNLLGITSGVINEAGQTLAVAATSDTPGLIPNPTIVYTSPNASATMTFTPVANVSGVAIITVTVTDNGGTANGGVNTFSQTFTVTVGAVNDAPTLNDPTDMTVLEDAAIQTVNLSGMTAGPNETQVLTVTATSDTPGLIPNPSVTYTSANTTGSLTFTPVANQSGSAIVTVTVTDNGGTANGGVNTFSQTFTVNVTAVNDAPTLNDPADVTILEDAALQTVNLSGITAGPLESQTLVVTATSGNPGLIPNPTVTYTSANTTGSLAFTPVANQSGSAVITVTVTDNGGTANGGVNTFSQTFTVNVTAVNDAPTLNDPADITILEDAALQTVNLSGITAGPFETQVLTVTASSNNTGLIPNPTVTYTSANATGTLTFTPVANANGTAIVTVTVTDDGGTANGGVNTFTQTFTVNVTAVNDPPTFAAGPNVTRVVNQGPQTVNPWATGITTGPANESGQTLTGFTVTGNTNPGLFSAAPAISTAGVLTFTSATGATGTASMTLTLSDNGGTANGGSDTSAPQTFTITINPGATTTALASSLNPSPLGAPVTFTATVTPNAPSGGVPQGTVEFRDNNVPIGTGTLNGAGVATFTTSSLTSGPHPITAVYLGSSAFNGSTSPVLTQVVDLPPTGAGTAPTVVTGGGTTHTVTVTYTDDFAINVASLDSNDIRVTGPNAFNSAVTFTGVNINTNGTPRVATYTFTAPGGSWDLGDNGTYSIVMQANQVVDSANQPVAVGSIGTFVVNIPPVTISGNIKQYVAGGPNTNLAGVVVTLTSNNVPVPGPATTNANGDYVISNVSHGANVVVTPSGLGKVYDPLTRTFNNVATNTTANFIAYDPNAVPRTITVVDTYPVPGAAVAVPIVMNSQGTETFVSFSLNHNINPLAANPTATCGAATAPGCTVAFNNVTPGQIGVTITNPVAFTAGPAEIAVINFQTLANNLGSTPLTFGDAPVVRLVRDGDGNPLPATYINGLIVFAQGLEGDVANRNTGNGTFESADVVQMRRFVAGLDTPVATNNEFQRADTAPASTKGDGNLNSTDLVQTRRYVAGLDASQMAGGAGTVNPGPIAPPVMERLNGASAAEVTIGKASGSTESRVSVPVGMRSNGDEVAVNFVIRYDAARLGNASVQLASAPDGATLTAKTDEPGVIRVLVDSSSSFARSNAIETLVNISFDIASTSPTGDTRILINETTISDARANSLGVKTTNGTISIAGPNAVALEISGRVLAPNGSGLRNAIVTLTDANGVTKTATTAAFGYYHFENITQGETYTITVSSRRFRFTQQRITPSDNLSGIDFTAKE